MDLDLYEQYIILTVLTSVTFMSSI